MPQPSPREKNARAVSPTFASPPPRPCGIALGLRPTPDLPSLTRQDDCPACTAAEHHTESPAFLKYGSYPLLQDLSPALLRRPFTRFDFADEWNNLGFGRIRTDDSP